MDSCHPAGAGLLGSGLVVSQVRAVTPLVFSLPDGMAMVSFRIPGKPCDVLVGFTVAGAARFVAELGRGFVELERLTGRPAPGFAVVDQAAAE